MRPFAKPDRTAMSERLIGKTIMAISVATDKKAIKFDLSDGESLVARTEGDCCSETWIEYLENPELAIGAPVLSVEHVPMRNNAAPRNICGNDFVQYYGCKIRTAKGDMLLEYRNASNGFYGGSLHWPDQGDFYGGVHEQNISTEKWTPIVPDR